MNFDWAEKAPSLEDRFRDSLPKTQDIKTLAESALPDLVRRAIMMAHESDKLNEVIKVIEVLADRAYGKAVTPVAVKDKDMTLEQFVLELANGGAIDRSDSNAKGKPSTIQ